MLQTVRSEKIRHPGDQPQLILVTDGRPSISMEPRADIRREVLSLARRFPADRIPAMVLATAEPGGLLKEIALNLKAPLKKLTDVVH